MYMEHLWDHLSAFISPGSKNMMAGVTSKKYMQQVCHCDSTFPFALGGASRFLPCRLPSVYQAMTLLRPDSVFTKEDSAFVLTISSSSLSSSPPNASDWANCLAGQRNPKDNAKHDASLSNSTDTLLVFLSALIVSVLLTPITEFSGITQF